MTVRSIPFKGAMVRAILEGRKTQTRRVLKHQPDEECAFAGFYTVPFSGAFQCRLQGATKLLTQKLQYCSGDLLWVREAWRADAVLDTLSPSSMTSSGNVHYEANGTPPKTSAWGRFRQGMFMPRWASRLTLRVTDVRVQQVQEISGDDAIAEGIAHADGRQLLNCYGPDCPTDQSRSCNAHGCWGCREDFRDLWDSINAKRGFGWEQNPWVAAYSFEVIRQNVDEVAA